MISQLSSVLLHCRRRGVIEASSRSQKAADAGFSTIKVFDNLNKDKDGRLETVYSSSSRSPCFHYMPETMVGRKEVSSIFARHKCSSREEEENESANN